MSKQRMSKLTPQWVLSAVCEQVVADISYLKQYLSMTDIEKGRDLLYQCSYIIDRYEDQIRMLAVKNKDTQLTQSLDDCEWYDVVYRLDAEPKYKNDFDKICTEVGKDPYKAYGRDGDDRDLPSWCFLSDPTIVRKQWLIHFTDNGAESIARNGFDYLTTDLSKLGLTARNTKESYDKGKDGYGFAYLLSDYRRFGKSKHPGSRGSWKYGKEAVLFLASGVRAWHNGDEEEQVIFKGDTVTDFVPIVRGHDCDFAIYSDNGRLIYENDDLGKVVDWVVKNYPQYRNRIGFRHTTVGTVECEQTMPTAKKESAMIPGWVRNAITQKK